MSDEARRLVDKYGKAWARDCDGEIDTSYEDLIACIERIERERDAQNVFEASYRKRLVVLDERIAELTRERDEARANLETCEYSRSMRITENEQHEKRIAGLEAENARLQAIVDEQAEDEGLWFVAETAPEAYLQQELRRLHAAIDAARKP